MLMKKSILFASISVFLCFGVVLTSCQQGEGNIIQSSDRNIASIELVQDTLPEVIVLGHFDDAGIKVKVTYSDGAVEEVTINSAFLGDEYADILQTVGTHQISILYKGQTINLTVKIVPAAYEICFYAREGEKAEFSLIKTQTVGYKEDATAPDIQNEVWDDVKHYTFVNWDVDFTSITKRLDVYAQYSSINYYTVNFYNGNEELITTQKVDEGSDAVEPTEEQRQMPKYDFVGWDRNYKNVTKNLNIYGIYQRVTYSEVHYDLSPEKNNNTIKYGLYPQTLVQDEAIITALENSTAHETGYYIYDEQFYEKVFVESYSVEANLTGNEQYSLNTDYWFKVEPIEWTITADENGLYTLQSSYGLDAKQFHTTINSHYEGTVSVKANNYEYSNIRKFLNDEFFEKAFMLNDSYIVKTLVDNSLASTGDEYNNYLCNDTNDKVWLQSKASLPSQPKGLTDYCQCMFDLCGDNRFINCFWTRTPRYDEKQNASYTTYNEVAQDSHWVTDVHGIRPMINIVK